MTDQSDKGKSFDHLVEHFLKVVEPYPNGTDFKSIFESIGLSWYSPEERFDTVINELLKHDLIVPFGRDGHYCITARGRIVARDIGYVEYIKLKTQKEKQEIEKTKWELELTKFQVRWKLLPFILSGIAIAVSIGTVIFDTLKSSDQLDLEHRLDSTETLMDNHKTEVQLNPSYQYYVPDSTLPEIKTDEQSDE